jgi:molybdopterin converting factor small subunit
MARVFLAPGLRPLAGGAQEVLVRASTVRDLIDALDARFPGMGERLRNGTAVAIDGEIVQEPLLEEVPPEAEVHFLPQIGGG